MELRITKLVLESEMRGTVDLDTRAFAETANDCFVDRERRGEESRGV